MLDSVLFYWVLFNLSIYFDRVTENVTNENLFEDFQLELSEQHSAIKLFRWNLNEEII